MKKNLLLLLVTISGAAQTTIDFISPFTICEYPFDGYTTFMLNTRNQEILNGLNPQEYSVAYFSTYQNAENNTGSLPNIYINTIQSQQTIYVRRWENANPGNYALGQFNLLVHAAPPSITFAPQTLCPGNPVLLSTNLGPEVYSFQWGKDNQPIPGANSPSLLVTQPGDYYVSVTSVNTATACTSYSHASVVNSSIGSASVSVAASTITIINAPEDAEFGLNGLTWQLSNIFTNLAPGLYIVYIRDICGNIQQVPATIQPVTLPPTGNDTQIFTQGQTLADVEVQGENIQWYATPGSTTLGTVQVQNAEEPLPLSTLLVNGTTYYASQTLFGVESIDRLPVTVNVTLGIEDRLFSSLRYYPNPVKDILTITNTHIDNVSVINMMGQTVLQQSVNSNSAQLNTGSLQQGVYFVKVTSGTAEKTVKIIKG